MPDIIEPDRLDDLAHDLQQLQSGLEALVSRYTRLISESEEYWNNVQARRFREQILDEVAKVGAFAEQLDAEALIVRHAAERAREGEAD